MGATPAATLLYSVMFSVHGTRCIWFGDERCNMDAYTRAQKAATAADKQPATGLREKSKLSAADVDQ